MALFVCRENPKIILFWLCRGWFAPMSTCRKVLVVNFFGGQAFWRTGGLEDRRTLETLEDSSLKVLPSEGGSNCWIPHVWGVDTYDNGSWTQSMTVGVDTDCSQTIFFPSSHKFYPLDLGTHYLTNWKNLKPFQSWFWPTYSTVHSKTHLFESFSISYLFNILFESQSKPAISSTPTTWFATVLHTLSSGCVWKVGCCLGLLRLRRLCSFANSEFSRWVRPVLNAIGAYSGN